MSIPLPAKNPFQELFEEEIEKAYPGYFDFTRVPWHDPLMQYKDPETRAAFVGFHLMHTLKSQ
jgi:hypothetical protein